jgi:hypothetical protein
MPAIPATWELEIGGLYFEASVGKKLARSHLKSKLGIVVDTCASSYLGGGDRRFKI